ncbi:MAG TPA: plastocyanin/azurin family copper-binding protein [Gemmatimonadaceae bacterium]|jgi:plastocyanin|nr:plastocyanin/azurin family copper-binding protein [Gemmatimonadaceae bacterium]
MRFKGVALVTSTVVLSACFGACGGSSKDAAPAASSTPAAAAPAAAAPAGGSSAALPITGKTWEVKMIGDGNSYKFDPANLTIKAGDGIKFTVVSTPPHNVAFDVAQPALADAAVKAQLDANMGPNKLGELSSPLLLNVGDSYTISFAGVKPGTYNFNCTPHLAMNMKGSVTVQ